MCVIKIQISLVKRANEEDKRECERVDNKTGEDHIRQTYKRKHVCYTIIIHFQPFLASEVTSVKGEIKKS